MKTEDDGIKDLFGYLPYKPEIKFNGGLISAINEFDKVADWIGENTNLDGFLYPPIVRRVKGDFDSENSHEEIPNSECPALLHRIPASHELCLYASGDSNDIRKSLGAFIIHLLAYLFGVRLQFHDWWFDGRVPIKSTHNVHFNERSVENFLSHCFVMWDSWPLEKQKLMTNVLYMHSRSPSYEWDWEQFMIEYMVFDGCWNLSEIKHKSKAKHKERMYIICQQFGIPENKILIDNIVSLRNDLFHETLWDKSQPCTGTDGPGFASSYHLRRFNQRLIPALFGYENSYIKSGWWNMGTFSFE